VHDVDRFASILLEGDTMVRGEGQYFALTDSGFQKFLA
jgi:hypothetical protein